MVEVLLFRLYGGDMELPPTLSGPYRTYRSLVATTSE